ncbi:hypothetical protein G5574_23360 (plasmid) [Pantoea stewartii]|uniref:putative phage abortive infection protein n=1 Tax=Pantoea stewartii TaxID=66269 RepID=UPI0013DE51DA|nr:putative phage abortive infection protein [Pantoea stewartii]QIE99924.1 hypothetical protein G5574_23360 [Pantoea stewartii]
MEQHDEVNKKIKRIVIFLVILALLLSVIWGVFKLFKVVFDNWSSLSTLITTLATTGGAIATWMAAKRAAESAQIARESMEATMHLGSQTLEETQATNRRTAFESRYNMLLAQHDNYHRQLCDYLDEKKEGVEEFFSKHIYDTNLDKCFSFLTGHQIISRYMRVLYHLLKYVRESGDFSGKDNLKFQKNYTSPLRSTIRNDVLLLIAVNALNVRDERAKNSSYPYYQLLLHDFVFFEHAIFMFPQTPNELFVQDDWPGKVQDLILNRQANFIEKLTQSADEESRSFEVPEVRLFSPVIMVMTVFENPMKHDALKALDSLPMSLCMKEKLHSTIDEVLSKHSYAGELRDKLPTSEYTLGNNKIPRKSTNEMFNSLEKEAFLGTCNYDEFTFGFYVSGVYQKHTGKNLRYYFRNHRRGENLVHLLDEHGGKDGYMCQLMKVNEAKVSNLYDEIAHYNVRKTR